MNSLNALYLTIDVGTTAVKVCAVCEDLKILKVSSREYMLSAEGDFVTLPPDVYKEQAAAGIREVLQKLSDEEKEQIKGITVTTQGETLIPVDKQGNALHDAVVWLDGRAVKQAEKIKGLIGEKEFYLRTGIPECNGLCPVSKLLWFKEERPEIYEKTACFLLLEDYMLLWLSGRMVTEKSLLSTTGYFDLQKDELYHEIFELTGLDSSKIPEVLDCGKRVGKILKSTAGALFLPQDIEIVTGAMDQVCGAIGAGNFEPGIITETTGTALCIGQTIYKKEGVKEENGRANNRKDCLVPVYRHFRRDLQLLLPVCMTAGMALKWFKDNFCRWEEEEAAKQERDVYQLLDELAGAAKPLSEGMIMLPYLSGSLQPYKAPEFRGGFYNVSLQCKKEEFIRALMEGVGYMLKENLLLLNQMQAHSREGETTKEMISMGGGAKSDVWCQIKADITGREIFVCEEAETASIGAAMLCAGGLSGEEEFRFKRKQAEQARCYKPDAENRGLYEMGYKEYSRLLKKMMDQ